MTPEAGIVVVKFGGTSVGSPEAIRQAVEVIGKTRSAWPNQVVVVSAMAGVTNQLLESAKRASQGDPHYYQEVARELEQRHLDVVEALVPIPHEKISIKAELHNLVEEFSNLCSAIHVLGEASPRALDTVAVLGERLNARLVASALSAASVPAQYIEANTLIITDEKYQGAHPDFEATREKAPGVLKNVLNVGRIPVVTGFMAATADGVTTTLGRGGSDYSAAILGTVLDAEEVWIWTDVDGVMTADPRLVPEARTIPTLSYREVAELAYFGAKVLHPKTIRPVIEAGIDLRICNTFAPELPGTRVVEKMDAKSNGKIKAVTAIRAQRLVTIEGRGMLGVPGVAARAFAAVAATGTSVILITQASSEQSICFSVTSDSVPEVLTALEATFAAELAQRDIDRIWATDATVIVTVVGAGLIHTPGIAGKIFTALGNQGVNVIAIAQGSTEVAISMVLDDHETERGVQALHDLIVKQRKS